MSEGGGSGHEAVFGLAEWLLAIDSPTGAERARCDALEARFRARSPHALIRADDSLCIVPRAPREGVPCVMLVGHLDTVPANGLNPTRREAGRLFGLGASDMKAADAVLIDALDRAADERPRHDLVGVLYAREEGSYADSAMPAIAAAAAEVFERSDLAICMEPTDGRIELGCLGTSHARVVFEGRAAHSARPWQGDNAIHKAWPLLAELAARQPRRHAFGELEFFEVVSATVASSPGARNVVPDRFELNLNYRFAPGQDEGDVRRALEELVGSAAEFELIDFCPAGPVCLDNPLVAELRAAAGDPACAAKQAWTDVARFGQLGIDAINWGPGATAQAHQRGEWVELRAVADAVDALGRWLWPRS